VDVWSTFIGVYRCRLCLMGMQGPPCTVSLLQLSPERLDLSRDLYTYADPSAEFFAATGLGGIMLLV
jgi:hypothetical protein